MRVLINAIHSKSGGGVTYLRNVVPELARQDGLELVVLLHRNQLDLFPGLENFARLHVVDFPDSMLRTQIWEQFRLPALARRLGADVTYSPANYGPLFAPRPVLQAANALAVVTKDLRPAKIAYWAAVGLLTLLSMLTARRVVAISRYARDALTGGVLGFLKRKFAVIPLGVAPVFTPGGRRGGDLLAVGDIYVQKNYHTLLRALARLDGARLNIAGRPLDPGYLHGLHDLIAQLGLGDRVAFLGSVAPERLRDLYRECALLVFPSTVETFGIPLIEAMACGAPIACSDRAAMPEVAGECAVFFDPDNVESMVSVLAALLGDETRRRDLSARGLVRAAGFTWAGHAAALAAELRLAAA